MSDTFSPWNWVVVVLYFAGVLAIGWAARRYQKTSEDFFVAGRSMGFIPVGLSLCMTFFSAISYLAIANQAYYYGLLLLAALALVWIDTPIICLLVIPYYYNLKLTSIYEYLEQRYSLTMRMVGSLIFLFWRSLWLGTVLYAPCKALQVVLEVATGVLVPIPVLVILTGVVTTVYTFLGGIRAVIWTDVAQFVVMLTSILAILVVVWTTLDAGPAEVWQTATAGGRTEWIHATFDLQDAWCLWGIIPFYFLARLSFNAADQITVQRVFTAKNLRAAQKAFVLNCVGLTFFCPLLALIGIHLYAFYQKQPQRIPTPYQAVSAEQVVTGALDAWPKIHPQTGEELEDKILPAFIARELPVGVAGLVIAALFAACMSTMDSGLNSVSTSLIVDFHRRLGLGKAWLARRLRKPIHRLDEADELTLAQPLTVAVGVFATSLGCVIGQLGTIFDIARTALDTPGIPLGCVFLLGMLTQRTNTTGALAGLVSGMVFILWLTLGPLAAGAGLWWIWPWVTEAGAVWQLAPIYPGVFGAVVTVVVAYGSSRFLGQRKSADELRGLAWGAGRPGRRGKGADVEEATHS